MNKAFTSLIAVAAFALVGCSSSDTSGAGGKSTRYSSSCDPSTAQSVLTVNEFVDQFNSNRARIEGKYKNVCIGIVGAPTELDKVVGQYELTLSSFTREKGSTSYKFFESEPRVVANFPRGDKSIESVSVKGDLVRVFGKFKNFNDAFGGLFVSFEVSMLDQGMKKELAELVESENLADWAKSKRNKTEEYASAKKDKIDVLLYSVNSKDGKDFYGETIRDSVLAENAYNLAMYDLALSIWEKYDPSIHGGDRVLISGIKTFPGSQYLTSWSFPSHDDFADQVSALKLYSRRMNDLRSGMRQMNHVLTKEERQLIAKYVGDSSVAVTDDTPQKKAQVTVQQGLAGDSLILEGSCSFNGVNERCVVEWDTDGTLYVTYLSDGKRVSYGTGDGKVRDGNRVYNAAVSNRGDHYIFTTQNGQTVIPVMAKYTGNPSESSSPD